MDNAESDGFNALPRRGADLAAGRHPADGGQVPAPDAVDLLRTTSRPPWSRTPPSRGCSSSCSRRGSTPLGMRVRRTRSAPGGVSDRRQGPRRSRRRPQPRPGPDHPGAPRRRPGRAADELLPVRLRWAEVLRQPQAGPDHGPRPARAATEVRDLGLRAARRGRAPPLRQGRPRWARWSEVANLHRDPRSGQGRWFKNAVIVPTSKGGFYAKQTPPWTGTPGSPRGSPHTSCSSPACST